jgi:hypothetical protein
LRTATKTRRSLGQLLEHVAKCNTWSERVPVSVKLFVIAISEPRHGEVKVLIHVLIHGFHGRPRDADLVAAELPMYGSYLNRNGVGDDNIRPEFWDSPNQKRDHFPVTVFDTSIQKLRGTSKVAQILGPKNGHVFETEGFEKCARELLVRYHLVPVFALPVGGWNVPQRTKYPASLTRQTTLSF